MKDILAIIFLFCLFASITIAQVSLDIGDGLTVETTGGLLVELSGDLEEIGTGYLKGVVSSGDRGADALTQFAGLIITSGAVDKITRTTGSAFSNTAPKTSLRSYEISNTTGITSNISSFYIGSGTNNESNGILRPYLFCYISGGWSGCVDYGTTENSIGASNIDLPTGLSNIVITEGVGVAAKLYLEGPYTSSVMSTSLTGNIPLVSPYVEDARTVSSIPVNAVDWVLVQLRDQTTPGTVISSRSAFLKNDGNIIDDLGNAGIEMASTPGGYYLAIKHRNHLSVMSSAAQSIDWITP